MYSSNIGGTFIFHVQSRANYFVWKIVAYKILWSDSMLCSHVYFLFRVQLLLEMVIVTHFLYFPCPLFFISCICQAFVLICFTYDSDFQFFVYYFSSPLWSYISISFLFGSLLRWHLLSCLELTWELPLIVRRILALRSGSECQSTIITSIRGGSQRCHSMTIHDCCIMQNTMLITTLQLVPQNILEHCSSWGAPYNVMELEYKWPFSEGMMRHAGLPVTDYPPFCKVVTLWLNFHQVYFFTNYANCWPDCQYEQFLRMQLWWPMVGWHDN